MDSQTTARVIAAAVSARAALDSLLLELTSDMTPDEVSETVTMEDGSDECLHSNKTPLGTFGSSEHWVCDDCGYEYRR